MTETVLVCGGRDYNDRAHVFHILDLIHREKGISCLVDGECPTGADKWAKEWAMSRNVFRLPFPANWHKYGRSAGPIRNSEMLEKSAPTLIVNFPGGNGTADMVKKAKAANVPFWFSEGVLF